MANGCLRRLKVISENPLISIYELEKIVRCLTALPLEHQCGAVRRAWADDQIAHVLTAAPADPFARQTQIAYRETDCREAHAARGVGWIDREMQPVGGRIHRLDFAARRLDQ